MSDYKIKNWHKFQHFKDRRPPWIKLYRDILDDIEWHNLPDESAKTLIMLWLMASENNGNIPTIERLSFRLRKTEKNVNHLLSTLSHWIEQSDINVISNGYQDDAPEKRREETERETETPKGDDYPFETFYSAYPKHKARDKALKAWSKINFSPDLFEKILSAVEVHKTQEDWIKDGGKYIPFPATWLNQKRWLDEVTENKQQEVVL